MIKYSTIRIEGSILSSDILDKIEQGNISGQSPDKFGFDNLFNSNNINTR
jgi:hypothetical protein